MSKESDWVGAANGIFLLQVLFQKIAIIVFLTWKQVSQEHYNLDLASLATGIITTKQLGPSQGYNTFTKKSDY